MVMPVVILLLDVAGALDAAIATGGLVHSAITSRWWALALADVLVKQLLGEQYRFPRSGADAVASAGNVVWNRLTAASSDGRLAAAWRALEQNADVQHIAQRLTEQDQHAWLASAAHKLLYLQHLRAPTTNSQTGSFYEGSFDQWAYDQATKLGMRTLDFIKLWSQTRK